MVWWRHVGAYVKSDCEVSVTIGRIASVGVELGGRSTTACPSASADLFHGASALPGCAYAPASRKAFRVAQHVAGTA